VLLPPEVIYPLMGSRAVSGGIRRVGAGRLRIPYVKEWWLLPLSILHDLLLFCVPESIWGISSFVHDDTSCLSYGITVDYSGIDLPIYPHLVSVLKCEGPCIQWMSSTPTHILWVQSRAQGSSGNLEAWLKGGCLLHRLIKVHLDVEFSRRFG
jgi:hypothetical protein